MWWLHLGVEVGCFPREEAALLASRYDGRNPLFAFDIFEKPETLLPQFQTALLISDQFVKDAAAQWFLRAASLAHEEQWRAAIEKHSGAEGIRGQLMGDGGQAAGVLPGFFRALEHMDASRQFFEDLARWPETGAPDLRVFSRRIGEIEAWRLDLHNRVVRSRFLQTQAMAATIVKEEDGENGASAFVEACEALATAWAGNHPGGPVAAAAL
jgi:hypothetical protein